MLGDRTDLPTDEPKNGFVSFSEAIRRIASLGDHLFEEETDRRSDEAQILVLDALGGGVLRGVIVAEGCRAGGVYEPIPREDWLLARSALKPGERISGDILRVGDTEWKEVRLRKSGIDGLLRHALFDLLHHGRITPHEAEVWAKHLSLKPLAPEADPVDFDPMREPDWSLAMGLAWVMTRDPNAVREVWDKWRERKQWQRQGLGWRLATGSPAQIIDLDALSTVWPEFDWPVATLEDAKSKLWRLLKSGDLAATGLPMEGGTWQEIPPHRWRDLKLYDAKNRLAVRDDAVEQAGFRDVALPATKVIELWPDVRDARGGRKPKYDWARFTNQAIWLLEERGDLNPALEPGWRQADLEKRMAEWCVQTWGSEPARSTIREYVVKALNQFRQRRGVGR